MQLHLLSPSEVKRGTYTLDPTTEKWSDVRTTYVKISNCSPHFFQELESAWRRGLSAKTCTRLS